MIFPILQVLNSVIYFASVTQSLPKGREGLRH
jgi:hypothetical protein